MYPAQTSFIPVQIALARFLETESWRAYFVNYPYWYLGTTPWRYLTGPVLPLILTGFHRLLPFLSLFEVFYLFLSLIWPLGAAGIYSLTRKLGGDKATAFLSAFFFFLGPLVPFFFRFSDGLSLVSFAFLPWVWFAYANWLKGEKSDRENRTVIAMVILVFFLDLSVFFSLLLGMAAMFLSLTGWKKTEKKIRKSLRLLFWSLLIVTFWYGLGYWWQLLKAPSLAGKSFWRILNLIGQLLPASLAVALGVLSEKIIKPKNRLLKFTFYFGFIFGFLTLLRFISDPDFWLDWTLYYLEIQLALGLILALVVGRLKRNWKIIFGFLLGLVWLGIWLFLGQKYVLSTFQPEIKKSPEYQVSVWLKNNLEPEEKVFLSGSSAFWLNAFFDLAQVRGGYDSPSVHPNWREAAWEIREGTDPAKAIKWLKELEVDYLVVHTFESNEFYHDFKYPEKFENQKELIKVYEQAGDRIYQVND